MDIYLPYSRMTVLAGSMFQTIIRSRSGEMVIYLILFRNYSSRQKCAMQNPLNANAMSTIPSFPFTLQSFHFLIRWKSEFVFINLVHEGMHHL
jgi:hypothetical protein